jgi:hypothetical protein
MANRCCTDRRAGISRFHVDSQIVGKMQVGAGEGERICALLAQRALERIAGRAVQGWIAVENCVRQCLC